MPPADLPTPLPPGDYPDNHLLMGGSIFFREGGGERPFLHKTTFEIVGADLDGLSGEILNDQGWHFDNNRIRRDYHPLRFTDIEPDGVTPTICRYFAKTEESEYGCPTTGTHSCPWTGR
jgi:hypothetical protein